MEQFLQSIVKDAGKIAHEYFVAGVTHRTKSHIGDLVTDADMAVSNFLVAAIHERYPDHHIHTEESVNDINPGAEFEWVIDPIDGTRNFAVGISFWCVMVAVLRGGQPYLSAIYHPVAEELFFAEKGKGATLNGERIHVNTVDSLDFGFGVCIRGDRTTHDVQYRRMVQRFAQETTVWMHNFGTMLASCYVASGGVDFMTLNSGFDHDYLAPALICAEAGALVTDCEGHPWQRYRRDLVIANPSLHPKILVMFG